MDQIDRLLLKVFLTQVLCISRCRWIGKKYKYKEKRIQKRCPRGAVFRLCEIFRSLPRSMKFLFFYYWGNPVFVFITTRLSEARPDEYVRTGNPVLLTIIHHTNPSTLDFHFQPKLFSRSCFNLFFSFYSTLHWFTNFIIYKGVYSVFLCKPLYSITLMFIYSFN